MSGALAASSSSSFSDYVDHLGIYGVGRNKQLFDISSDRRKLACCAPMLIRFS